MDLKIVKINIKGDEDSEYVYIKVINDCNLYNYMIMDTSYTDKNRISNKIRHTFWFPKKQVKKGEYVSVRTGEGDYIKTSNAAGHTIHRYFWGLGEPIWNDDGDAAVLFQISDWKTTRAV